MDIPKDRRARIIELLKEEDKPLTGTALAKELEVSRQVIVQDIALLRAQGYEIISTPQGYMFYKLNSPKKLLKTLACKHNPAELEKELEVIIDLGGHVLDVIVEHPLYGDLRGNLNLKSKYDLQEYMENLKKDNAVLLSALTGGVHLHTIEVENEEMFTRIKDLLKKNNLLID